MAIVSEQLAQLTARSGVMRSGTGRSAAAPKSYELKSDGSGQILWNRPVMDDGRPPGTVTTSWTTLRE